MKYFELHDLYNVAKIIFDRQFKDGDLVMGIQKRTVEDLSLHKITTQQIKAGGKLQDFYRPSSNLSMRVIVSSKAKSIIEYFRKDGFRFYPCPLIRGKDSINGYWITDKVIFDDKWVDFRRSEFFFRKRKLLTVENDPKARYEVTEKIIQFNNLAEYNRFLKREMWHLDEIYPFRIFIKNKCPYSILSIHTTGPRYLIVSEEVKNEIQQQKMDKGIEFKPLEISDEEWGGPNGLRKQFYS